jgi:Protein of unknown function (DUF3137)
MAIVDLANLDEAGFAALYEERIEPLFSKTETERLTKMGVFRQRLTYGLPAAVGLALIVFFWSKAFVPAVIVGGLAALAAYGYAQHPLSQLGTRLKAETLHAFAQALDADYHASGAPQGLMERFRSLDLLPKADRENFEDWFQGERHGCSFDMFEGHLEDERRDKDGDREWVTVFRGQIIRIQFPKEFHGVTVVRRDAGVFNALSGWATKLGRVGFADPAFERKFEVFGSDQVEARVLVHPVFAERLLELEQRFDGRNLRCGFQGGDLLIGVETQNRFEIGDMMKPLTDPARAKVIMEDIGAVLRVMDAVLTAEQATLMRFNQERGAQD